MSMEEITRSEILRMQKGRRKRSSINFETNIRDVD
jgi:hypothetical protein